jgi:hypothetical protein
MKTITKEEYMSNSSELHHSFYSQFVTESTKAFVLDSLTVEGIQNALGNGDEHLNKIKIPFNNMGRGGSWWWDNAPFNIALAKELGAVGKNSHPSPSTHTCIGKAAAKMLAATK